MIIIYLKNNGLEEVCSVIKLIDDNDRYYVDVIMKPVNKRIELKSEDYYKILTAAENNQKAKIFPVKGIEGYVLEIS